VYFTVEAQRKCITEWLRDRERGIAAPYAIVDGERFDWLMCVASPSSRSRDQRSQVW
jgi:hypothetical protein